MVNLGKVVRVKKNRNLRLTETQARVLSGLSDLCSEEEFVKKMGVDISGREVVVDIKLKPQFRQKSIDEGYSLLSNALTSRGIGGNNFYPTSKYAHHYLLERAGITARFSC